MEMHTIDELNSLYDEAESVDREVFSEQRSNVLLISGDHYSRKMLDHFSRLRGSNDNSVNDQKLRLTKNHTYRIVRHYVSNILDYCPSTTIVPQRDDEIKDQKMAEQYKAVWENHFKLNYRIDEVVREAAQDFCGVGEVCYKLSFDPNQGKILGYEQLLDAEGEPVFEVGPIDPMTGMPTQGEPQVDEDRPVMEGRFVIDRIFAANLLRHPSAKAMRTSQCHIIRYMANVKDLKKKYEGDKEKLKYIEESSKEDFVVFDSAKQSYGRSKGQCLMREFYYRPCSEYPEGYYFITTSMGILEQGVLPFGIYPLVWAGFDEYNTNPRGRSIVKVIRPFQAEINRAGSMAATQQVTLGSDKLLYAAGSKLSSGTLLPGVRGITYQGPPPTVMPGRDGGQFSAYIAQNIEEMDRASMVSEINLDKEQNVDPMTALFQSVAQKKRFSVYIKKFEQFLIDFTMTLMELAKQYLTDEQIIAAIGVKDQVNLPEFRNPGDLSRYIKVVPREDTMETQLGKQVMISHFLQYAGNNLDKQSIGKLAQNIPYGNFQDTFSEFMIDSDNVKSDILALERGEYPTVGSSDDNAYYVKKLTHRMKQKDFQFLDPQIQQNFEMFRQEHEMAEAEKLQQVKAMESELIPRSGAMIACDMYIPSEDPSKAPKRVRVPYESLDWLIKTLEAQGGALEQLEAVNNQGAQADIASMALGASQSPGVDPYTGGMSPGQGGGFSQ